MSIAKGNFSCKLWKLLSQENFTSDCIEYRMSQMSCLILDRRDADEKVVSGFTITVDNHTRLLLISMEYI